MPRSRALKRPGPGAASGRNCGSEGGPAAAAGSRRATLAAARSRVQRSTARYLLTLSPLRSRVLAHTSGRCAARCAPPSRGSPRTRRSGRTSRSPDQRAAAAGGLPTYNSRPVARGAGPSGGYRAGGPPPAARRSRVGARRGVAWGEHQPAGGCDLPGSVEPAAASAMPSRSSRTSACVTRSGRPCQASRRAARTTRCSAVTICPT